MAASLPSLHSAGKITSLHAYSLGERISGESLTILKELSQRGMNSSGKKACGPLITEASRRTGLNEQQILEVLFQRLIFAMYLACT